MCACVGEGDREKGEEWGHRKWEEKREKMDRENVKGEKENEVKRREREK